jgi:hypothetical protein
MHYTGNLTYGGGVQGSCPIDVTVTSSGSAATYHGTVCGISITSP